MKVFSDIVHSFDPGGGPRSGSISGGRRSSGRPSGGDDSGKMNNFKNMMQSRAESPGRAERRKSALLTGQGTHFQSSALRTDMRKDSGAYMEEDYGYSRMKPSTARRQDMGYDYGYGYGYEEERMMPGTMRGSRMDDRQPMRYQMDEEDMGYMEEEPRRTVRMPRAGRAKAAPQQRMGYVQEQPLMQQRPQRRMRYIEDQPRMEAAPQQVRYVQEQPRMQAAGASRAMGMGYEEEQPQGETYRASHMGGKTAMKTPAGKMQTRYVQDQPRVEAAGASRSMGDEEQPQGHVYRTSHIGAKPSTKHGAPQMHTRYIQEQPRMETYPVARPSREAEYREEQPRGQMVRISPAKPAMKPASQRQMKYVQKEPPKHMMYVQKEPQRHATHARMEPQREVMRAPRISGSGGQPRMRYDQVPRQSEPARVPHINGKPATQVATGQQGMGYTQEQQRPATVSIPHTEGGMQPVRTSKTTVPSMRSQRNRRMSVREPTAKQEQRRESIQSIQSTQSTRTPLKGTLGVHDSRDAAVSAAAAAILGGQPKSQRKPVTRIPMAPTGEFGAEPGVPRRDSATLAQEQPVYYYPVEEQYMMEEPTPRGMEGRLSEDIYGPEGTYETIEREPPVVAETVMPPRHMGEQAVEEVPEEKEAKREPERVVVNEPVTVGQPIREHVVLPDEGVEREEEREGEWYEPERLVEPRRLVEPQPALVEPVITEEVVEEEMEHPGIGMPDDEDIAREARAKQAEAYEAREVMPVEEAAEEEFQPAREVPSDVSEDEWDASEEEEDAEEQWQMSEPQPLGPLSAMPVMAQQPVTTTTSAMAPAVSRQQPVTTTTATKAPEVPRQQPTTTTTTAMASGVPRQQPTTTAAPVMLPGVPRHQPTTTVEPVMASDIKTAAPSVPAEEYGTAAAPTVAPAMVTDIGAETVTHPATYETMHEPRDFEQPVTTSAVVPPATHEPVEAVIQPPTTQAPVMESTTTTLPATAETAEGYYESARPSMESRRAIPITTSAHEPTILGTKEPVSAAEHQERAYATQASADAGATGRISTDEPMHGTTRSTPMEKQDQSMYEQPRTSMADEKEKEQARAMKEEESESRARTAAAAAASKEAPSGTSTSQAYAGSDVPPDIGAAAATPAAASMATGGPGTGTNTESMNRADKRRLEKEEKARQKQRAKEEKAHQQNLKAQNERLEKQRKEEEKQRLQAEKKAQKEAKQSKKHQEKETMQRRKSQQKEEQVRRKSQQKEEKDMQRRQSAQQQRGQAQGEGEGGGLSGIWRRMSRTFTGSEGSRGNSASGASQGTRTQQGAQQMQDNIPGRAMETTGRPQEIAH